MLISVAGLASPKPRRQGWQPDRERYVYELIMRGAEDAKYMTTVFYSDLPLRLIINKMYETFRAAMVHDLPHRVRDFERMLDTVGMVTALTSFFSRVERLETIFSKHRASVKETFW